jgi:hypothetical protein
MEGNLILGSLKLHVNEEEYLNGGSTLFCVVQKVSPKRDMNELV